MPTAPSRGRRPSVDGVDRGFMIHDFAITERYLVLTVAPAVFDIDAMLAGGDMLAWRPELGVRIAVIARDGASPPRWFEHDAVLGLALRQRPRGGRHHRARLPALERSGLPHAGAPRSPATYRRAVLDLDAGTVTIDALHDVMSEFPRIDDRRTGTRAPVRARSRRAAARCRSNAASTMPCAASTSRSGTWAQYPSGGAIGEAVFVPRPGGTGELDGYYLAFVNASTGSTPRSTSGTRPRSPTCPAPGPSPAARAQRAARELVPVRLTARQSPDSAARKLIR